ncbi:MAG TPA: histidine phosphatase family protein [Candidatus Limnocylindrales bacterium]|nr:histidine phosphatase family protein [Candidatus Limnocylindrales bacterium]
MHDGPSHGTTTQLCLLRHADAGDPEAWTGPDDARPLSGKGEKQSRRLGRFLAEVGFEPDAIISSPKLRARQTAELVAEALGREVAIDERLAGGLDTVAIEAILFDAGEPVRPILVGHDPDFSELAAWTAGARRLPMKKGAFVRIDTVRPISEASGTLRWLVPPDLLSGR